MTGSSCVSSSTGVFLTLDSLLAAERGVTGRASTIIIPLPPLPSIRLISLVYYYTVPRKSTYSLVYLVCSLDYHVWTTDDVIMRDRARSGTSIFETLRTSVRPRSSTLLAVDNLQWILYVWKDLYIPGTVRIPGTH